MTTPDATGMTPELRQELRAALMSTMGYADIAADLEAIAPIIARLVAEAWEDAAKVADVQASREIFEDRRGFCKATARDIAAAIRARKPQP